MSTTTDRNDPLLRQIESEGNNKGQQKAYLVLSDEERAKGFVRPVRRSYIHRDCGTRTTMGQAIAETYARNPKFYGGTFCCNCGRHFPLQDANGPAFFWEDGEPVGSTAEEALVYMKEKQRKENEKNLGGGI